MDELRQPTLWHRLPFVLLPAGLVTCMGPDACVPAPPPTTRQWLSRGDRHWRFQFAGAGDTHRSHQPRRPCLTAPGCDVIPGKHACASRRVMAADLFLACMLRWNE